MNSFILYNVLCLATLTHNKASCKWKLHQITSCHVTLERYNYAFIIYNI